MNQNSSDIFARLLAEENLTVVRTNTSTAYFDTKARILNLPLWKDMTAEVEEMLIGHEVGHALFTTEEYTQTLKENNRLKSYMNVLEDVRVEKKIKRKYPGMRRTFIEGYKQLNDRDFFSVRDRDLSPLLLIDRINIYYKCGFNSGVRFSNEEQTFVQRAEKTETINDVIVLATEIYEYSKKKLQERKKNTITLPQQEDGEIDVDELLDDLDLSGDDDYIDLDQEQGEDQEVETQEEGQQKESKDAGGEETEEDVPNTSMQTKGIDPTDEVTEQELESETEQAYQKNLSDAADTNTSYEYCYPHPYNVDGVIVDYKRVIRETSEVKVYAYEEEANIKTRLQRESENFDKFMLESNKVVNYLVKEFEMRKSAQAYKRATVSKTGSLNTNKLFSYKLTDDIFRRVTVLPDGKNHGMVFLLDWSGSMCNQIQETIEQVINLAMFCQRAQIKYRVFAFTSDYHDRTEDERYSYAQKIISMERNSPDGALTINSHMRLLEFFNDRMTNAEFKTMCKRLHTGIYHNTGYGLGGTPLNEALVYMYQYLGEFKKNNSIEKLSFITLTDGEGGFIYPKNVSSRRSGSSYYDYRSGTTKKIRVFMRNPKNKKTYEVTGCSTHQTNSLLQMIKETHDCRVVGFYVCQNSRRVLYTAIQSNLTDPHSVGIDHTIENIRQQFRSQGFASLEGSGRDDLFIVPSNTKIEDGELSVDAEMTPASIARSLSKFMKGRKTSRVLLTRFMEYVA